MQDKFYKYKKKQLSNDVCKYESADKGGVVVTSHNLPKPVAAAAQAIRTFNYPLTQIRERGANQRRPPPPVRPHKLQAMVVTLMKSLRDDYAIFEAAEVLKKMMT
ncbi:hypothetical protein EVAR_27078_1 [Eumeta japonica]|uniref:Uncharacterized protein n=1 Tax=Eumeta variegata TaxID=151549 RepID=A0A4C1VKG4_EUMVA|nr:hypothetical protein EVAR_27078_1 [Eumeta japonica]